MFGPRIVRFLLAAVFGISLAAALPAQTDENLQEQKLEEARRKLRKGELTTAEALFEEIVFDSTSEEEPEDGRPSAITVEQAKVALLDIAERVGDYEKARDGLRALPEASLARREAAFCRRA